MSAVLGKVTSVLLGERPDATGDILSIPPAKSGSSWARLEQACEPDVEPSMPSTVIRRYVYDHSNQQLWVEFVTGGRYVYSRVPETVAAALGSAFAKGVYFNTRIRDHFPHREVTNHTEDEETQS